MPLYSAKLTTMDAFLKWACPEPSCEVQLSTRARINYLVKYWAYKAVTVKKFYSMSVAIREVWRFLYRALEYTAHVKIYYRWKKAKAAGQNINKLDLVEQLGLLDHMYAIAYGALLK